MFKWWPGSDVEYIAAGNAILAWVACMVSMWAAWKLQGMLRSLFATIGVLALFYSLAYWWLYWFPDRGAEWSEFLRPFGLLTWVLAWQIEPYLVVRADKREQKWADERGQRALIEAEEARQKALSDGVD